MRILLVHPNSHSGRAEIAGNWPPARAAYLAGGLKRAGGTDIHFVDAMTDHLSEDDLARRIRDLAPDVIGVMRDRELLPLWRRAGLVHVSLGTEAAAQLKLDRFNRETKVQNNRDAIRLLREADIFTEAQFIVGLDNETPETLEESYQMAWDWQPDLANWSMYTPWPFSQLFQEPKGQRCSISGTTISSPPS